jgi:cephalosporin-C deacetylase
VKRGSGSLLVDLPLSELAEYRPEVAEPEDFESFWRAQITEARSFPLDANFSQVAAPIRHARVFDVTFSGHGGDRIKAWLYLPLDLVPAYPVVVQYVGYGGGRGDPLDWLDWSACGFAHFVMDNRGQGGGWRGADTPDPHDGGYPSTPGFMTRGIRSPAEYYYCRLYVDAVRAVEAAVAYPDLRGKDVVITGGSQGGALTIVAAAWAEGVRAAMADVVFMSHFRRALEVSDSDPYQEVAKYCSVYPDSVEAVFHTLSYFDVVNHAKRSAAPALFSVGLVDLVTPPSTVFAAFNHYRGEKEICVYRFNGHEGGGRRQFYEKLNFLRTRLGL